MIYLDNNATTRIDPLILEETTSAMHLFWGNPSSTHQIGQNAKKKLSQACSEITTFFGIRQDEFFFTSGATEGLNTLIRSYISHFTKAHIITSILEHEAVYQTCLAIEKEGIEVSFLSPNKGEGAILPSQVLEAIRPNTQLIVLMWANNETGAITDIPNIASVAKRKGIAFLVDGVASLGKMPCQLPDGVTAACFSGHKIHAPKGCGLAIIRDKTFFTPLIIGGPQQGKKRGGTENLPAIIGFANALYQIRQHAETNINNMRRLRDLFENALISSLQGTKSIFAGSRICNTSNISFENVDGETLLIALDQAGIAASHGAACSSGALEPSRVLLGMGYPKKIASSSIRFSLSRMTTLEEIEKSIEIIVQTVTSLRD